MPRDGSAPGPLGASRRGFLERASSLAMAGGLLGAYGTFAAFAGRFLYPAGPGDTAWVFVAEAARVREGDSIEFRTPDGAPVNVARLAGSGDVSDFVALSSTCPHLGCRVHWESHNERFFCPCHNGVFRPDGKAIAGPPGEAGQSLPRYPLKLERGLLFVEVPVRGLARAGVRPRATPARPGEGARLASGPRGPGQDPCLFPDSRAWVREDLG